jgi:4-hydroxybenzoate polyprenyltransferase
LTVMKRTLLAVVDRFFLLRPLVLVPAITFFILGHDDACRGVGTVGIPSSSTFLAACVCYAVLMGSVYILNQIADVESDAINEKLFLLPRGVVGKGEALAWVVVLSVISMAGAFLLGGRMPLYFGLSLVLGLAYSIPPLALKRRFPFDLAANALGYGVLAYACGWSTVVHAVSPDLTRALPFALCVGGVFILTALADREGDAESGLESTGVVLTPRQGVMTALCLVASALPLALLVENRVAVVGSISSLPFFAYAALKTEPRSIRIAYRCGPAVFVLIVGVFHPAFLLIVVALLVLARLYYSKRFALGYPSIAGR